MNEHDPEIAIIENANGFTMVNTRALEPVQSLMFFQFNMRRYFTQRFQVKRAGRLL